jgi:hypothetical protein
MKFSDWTPKFFLQKITAPNGESWSYNKIEVPVSIGIYTTGIMVHPGHSKWIGKVILVGMLGLNEAELALFKGELDKIETLTSKVFYPTGETIDRPEDYWGRA